MFKQRSWVGYVSRGPVLSAFELQNRIHECSEWTCSNQPLNIPILSADQRIWCKSQLYTTPERQTVPCARYSFRHAPDNVYVTQLEGSDQVFCRWHAELTFVIPFDNPTTRMDSHTTLLFLDQLRAQDKDKARTALFKLGVIRKEDAPVLPGQVSIARLRTILTGLCACFRLRKRYKGFRYLGTCKIFCTMETCPHELYARFLDYDSEVTMACLSEWNQVQDPESIVAESAQPSAPLGSLREHIPESASCDSVVYAAVLNGAWQSESRETSGSNINKKKSCNYSFKISYRQRVEILSTLKDSKSPKEHMSAEPCRKPSVT